MSDLSITIINDKNRWNNFVFNNTTETFHQSWEWGEVYEKNNHKIWRAGLTNKDGQLLATCLIVKIQAKRGTFLLIPHGPLFNNKLFGEVQTIPKDPLAKITRHLIELARNESCVFVRIAPISPRTLENDQSYYALGYKDAPIFVQSEESLVLNIEAPNEELLKNMRKSTRYILKNQDSYPIRCIRTTSPDEISKFCDIYTQTVVNQGFFGQSTTFITQEFDTFSSSGCVALYFAYHNNKPLAAAFVIEQNNTGYYHYGASIRTQNNLPAPHLLQWYIINDLKARNFTRYNFWGVAPENKPNHPWAGLSLFKKGFGGEVHQYTKTKDYIVSQRYWANWLIEKIRSVKRGY